MSFRDLKQTVYEANMQLHTHKLVVFSWGNVSQIDRQRGVVAIKPSGVPYEALKPDDIVIVDLDNNIVEGELKPSSDTKTHTHLYRHFDSVGGICHTHSTYATAWAQVRQPIPCYGTTHADYAYGDIPCTAVMTDVQVEKDYEEETGVQISDCFAQRDPVEVPMVIVAGHAPFTWGNDAAESIYHAVILEEIAKMAYLTRTLDPNCSQLKQTLVNKHYQRKHGKNAYYGQR